ncbi:phasin family protein [Methylibium sp.]|jgi:poly(hydroxyalkanoate) granule-associated protein|uniref:phasin family protein n=1 Tax=Methylibium sp. TaxID=2067992 RepID=UPI003BAD7586
MVKKLQKLADKQGAATGTPSVAQLFDNQFASSVKDSAQQIWQAGLGAFAKAQGEGGKVFESLVKEGVSIQRKTQAAAEEKLGEVSSKMTKLSDDVQARAGQQWDKLESIFEERVAKALGKLGVPSSKDIDALIHRIDALSANVARLSKAPAARKTAPAKTAAAPRKTAAKTASAKRAVAAPRKRKA